MQKVKLKERIENAVNAFFETPDDLGETSLVFPDGAGLMETANRPNAIDKADRWLDIARQLFLFAPGAFLVYFGVLSAVYFYPELGLTLPMAFLLFAGTFLSYAGVGSIWKRDNLVVPASIAAFAAIIAIFTSFLPASIQPDIFFWYSIFLFPLALVTAKLMQVRFSDK